MEGLIGAIANITGVTRYKGYDNDTSETDINGVPAHAVSMVVDGGDAEDRPDHRDKNHRAPTFGTTTVIVKDAYGTDKPIHFSGRPKFRFMPLSKLRCFTATPATLAKT